jgi:hypothetical protein
MAGVKISDAHKAGVVETQDFRINRNTMRRHRNNIRRIIEWLDENYSNYRGAGGIHKLTEEQLNDPTMHHFANAEDLEYEAINADLMLAFFADHKVLTGKKKEGKFRSESDMKKFSHSILFGAREARKALPVDYHVKVDDFMKAYKKETVTKKTEGKMDNEDSDPILFPLYRLICQWALQNNNVFIWVFTLLQWNCMARSISIDPLGFHNFRCGTDSIKITYDKSKADQSGEKVSPKNVYANPFDPTISLFLGIGIWLSLKKETFVDNDSFFLGVGEAGSAAHRYCLQLSDMLKDFVTEVAKFARPDRTKSHGTRKGSAIHSTSGTTMPPPLPSMAQRGEWSQGSVFDVYYLFAEPGDQYLGRCLAGLDPNSIDFAVLPPYFTVGLDDADVTESMAICFGDLDERYHCTGLLSILLPSIIHSIDFYPSICCRLSGTFFDPTATIAAPRIDSPTERQGHNGAWQYFVTAYWNSTTR